MRRYFWCIWYLFAWSGLICDMWGMFGKQGIVGKVVLTLWFGMCVIKMAFDELKEESGNTHSRKEYR